MRRRTGPVPRLIRTTGSRFAACVASSCTARMKILVTGSSGLIGRAVCAKLEARGVSAVPFDMTMTDSDGERLSFDQWVLDLGRRELTASNGGVRELTTAEFDLLSIFAHRPGRVLSRDNIMDLLKGHEWSPYDRSIDSLIVRLRKKIEQDPETPRLIKTVRGIGYVFAADVQKH